MAATVRSRGLLKLFGNVGGINKCSMDLNQMSTSRQTQLQKTELQTTYANKLEKYQSPEHQDLTTLRHEAIPSYKGAQVQHH